MDIEEILRIKVENSSSLLENEGIWGIYFDNEGIILYSYENADTQMIPCSIEGVPIKIQTPSNKSLNPN